MIATRVELRQPQYVPIDVTAVVRVRNYYENARSEIEAMLQKELDYITSDHGFGETIHFTELYRRLETMQCVDSVYSLSMHPAPGTDAVMQGADIVLRLPVLWAASTAASMKAPIPLFLNLPALKAARFV